MSGNSFGEIFKVTSFGESHGKAIGVVIEGLKAGLELDLSFIQKELNKRKPGASIVSSPRREDDKIEVLSGVFEGKTLGTPLCIIVWNKDAKSSDYNDLKNVFRPGHADFTWFKKFGFRDYRGSGRSSARETIARVIAGAIAKKELLKKGIKIVAFTKQVGAIKVKKIDLREVDNNVLKCPDKVQAKKMLEQVLETRKKGDSLGGVVELRIQGAPIGLGEPVFSKLDAELSKAIMSIGAVKGIEFGAGFKVTELSGKQNNDELIVKNNKVFFKTNNAGGILGGISSGQEIVVRIAVKPTSSILIEQETITIDGENTRVSVKGRHDACICPRIIPVVEAMASIVLYDFLLLQKTRE